MEYYSAIKKNEIMPFAATWMDLAIIILSEVNQTLKDKYMIHTHTHTIFVFLFLYSVWHSLNPATCLLMTQFCSF